MTNDLVRHTYASFKKFYQENGKLSLCRDVLYQCKSAILDALDIDEELHDTIGDIVFPLINNIEDATDKLRDIDTIEYRGLTSSKKAIKSSHDWDDFDKFSDILDKYLPASGEGETMASQVATAVSKLVYKWFNDGDVYDNTHQLEGWANDLSTYANWLYRYADAKFLDEIEDAESESDYEDILYSLCENLAVPEKLVNWDNEPKVDSVYKCEGPFQFVNREDEDDDDEDIESSRKSIKSSKDDEDDWDNLDDSEDSENTVSFTVEDAVYEAFPMASPHTIEIITKWYENEYAAEDFDDVSEFSDYIYDDIYNMLDAADVSEKNEVIKDLNNAGYIDYDEDDYEGEDIESSRKAIKSSNDNNEYGFYWEGENIYDKNGIRWYFGDYINGNTGIEPYSSYIQAVKTLADDIENTYWSDEISDPQDYAEALIDYAVETLDDPGKFIKEYNL